MKVNIAVCGKFHYHNYVKYLFQAGLLNQFYYSHRLSTNASALSVGADHLANLWIRQYLVGLQGRLVGDFGQALAIQMSNDIWEAQALKRWRPCDIFHAAIHGASRKLMRRARGEGSIVVGEHLNIHPEALFSLLQEEHERLGIKSEPLVEGLRRRLEEIALCDRLLVGAEMIRRSFVAKGVDDRRIHTIPYGVDLERFQPVPAERDGAFRVICVAHVSPRKGQVYLLEAMKRLRLPRAELLLIGHAFASMKPLLARYTGQFKHLAHVPNHELKRYYGRASVFVLPSISDGFAYVCAEAMACGLPVIATENTGASELIEHGRDGFVVPIRSPDAIAAHLEALYRDETLRDRMAAAALEKARRCFGWDIYAGRLADWYRAITVSSA